METTSTYNSMIEMLWEEELKHLKGAVYLYKDAAIYFPT